MGLMMVAVHNVENTGIAELFDRETGHLVRFVVTELHDVGEGPSGKEPADATKPAKK